MQMKLTTKPEANNEASQRPLPGGTPVNRLPQEYLRLRQIARSYVSKFSCTESIQATELVHMAWMKLEPERNWKDREEFLAYTAVVMKNLLLDRARKRIRQERYLQSQPAELSHIQTPQDCSDDQFIILNQALEEMQDQHSELAKLIAMRFFIGLSNGEIAQVLDSSERTVKRKMAFARAYLKRSIDKLNSADD
tara:strand:- start:98 stop:679 length:582 start_codon:yes stop_codon:yes gene_type:complete